MKIKDEIAEHIIPLIVIGSLLLFGAFGMFLITLQNIFGCGV